MIAVLMTNGSNFRVDKDGIHAEMLLYIDHSCISCPAILCLKILYSIQRSHIQYNAFALEYGIWAGIMYRNPLLRSLWMPGWTQSCAERLLSRSNSKILPKDPLQRLWLGIMCKIRAQMSCAKISRFWAQRSLGPGDAVRWSSSPAFSCQTVLHHHQLPLITSALTVNPPAAPPQVQLSCRGREDVWCLEMN